MHGTLRSMPDARSSIPPTKNTCHTVLFLCVLAAIPIIATTGCSPVLTIPALATRPYPAQASPARSIDIHVTRMGEYLELRNMTRRSFREFDLWINRRYVSTLPVLPAHGLIEVSLWDFFDENGERINAGGFWITAERTIVYLVEIQEHPGEEIIGLLTTANTDPF